jgi:hypothetical protein
MLSLIFKEETKIFREIYGKKQIADMKFVGRGNSYS